MCHRCGADKEGAKHDRALHADLYDAGASLLVSVSFPSLTNVRVFFSQAEIISALSSQAGVQPSLTCLVWQKLEEQNPDFFYAYNVMLRVKDQVCAVEVGDAFFSECQWHRLPFLARSLARPN